MASLIKKIRNESFLGNLLVMGFGSLVTIGVGFIFTPFLSRIYSPEEYGSYSFFRAIASNLGMIASLNFVNALLLTKSQRSFISLFALILLLSGAMSIFFYIPISLIVSAGGIEKFTEIGNWAYFIPVFVFVIVINQGIQAYNAHRKKFRLRAIATTSGVASGKAFALFYGLAKQSTTGLIIGEFITLLIDITIGIPKKLIKTLSNKELYKKNRLFRQFTEYKSYPKYALPANWLNLLNEQLPVFFIGYFFLPELLGQYSFAIALLNLPLMVISKAFSPVFLQKLTELKDTSSARMEKFVSKFYLRLFFAGLFPFILFLLFGEWIFLTILGSQWALAAEFSKILVYMYMVKICVSPLTVLYRVARKERLFLILTILSIILTSSGLYFGNQFGGILGSLTGFTIGSLVYYFVASNFYLKMAGVRHPFKIQSLIISILILIGLLNYFI